jgi:hypothetical protein
MFALKSGDDRKKIFLIYAFIVLAMVKFIIISGNEIVSEGSDSVEYLLLAKAWFWGWNQLPIRGPGYPIFVALLHFFNLPLRVTSEFLFILASSWFCYSLLLMRLPVVIISVVFITLLYHPLTFLNLDMPMSEGLFVTLLLISLGALVRVILSDSFRSQLLNSIIFGLSCILMIHTRESDKNIIYLVIAEVFLCTYFLEALRKRSFLVWHALVSSAATVAIILLINLVVFSANYAVFGSFGYNKIADASTLRLIHTMMMIDTGEAPLHPRILITTKARKIAYQLSPTLAPYEQEIEEKYLKNKEESNYSTYSRTGIKGQLDTEDTMSLIGNLCDPIEISQPEDRSKARKTCNRKIDQISEEISSALDAGNAKQRMVFYIFNPSLKILMPSIHNSLHRILASFFHYAEEPIQTYYPFYGSLFAELYDKMANRNSELLKKGPLEGFLVVPRGDVVSSMHFVNSAVDFFRTTIGDPHRFSFAFEAMKSEGLGIYEDMELAKITPINDQGFIPDTLKKILDKDQFYLVKFHIPAVKDRVFLHFMKFVITLDSGKHYTIRDLEQGPILESDNESKDSIKSKVMKCVITKFDLSLNPVQKAGYETQKWIFKTFDANSKSVAIALTILLIIAITASTILITFRRNWRLINPRVLCVCGILVSAILIRVCFYTLVDATVFPINLERHLFAASILVFPIIIILSALSIISVYRQTVPHK